MPGSHGPLLPFLAALGLAASACGMQKSPTEPGNPPDPNATFQRVQAQIFTPSCALSGCHSGPTPKQGMNLSAGNAYANIVNVVAVESTRVRIAPGDPDGSYMVSKVKGDSTIAGSRMPLGGALPPERIQLLVDWVRRGAPND